MFLMRTTAKSLASETQHPAAFIAAADSPWNGLPRGTTVTGDQERAITERITIRM